jgi:hypothetical protein
VRRSGSCSLRPAGRDQGQKETAEDLGVDPKDLDQALQEAMKQI